jgi:hypothetical protein
MTEFSVHQGDVVSVPSDLLLLKHAQNFYGADQAVARRLISARVCAQKDLQPAPGEVVVFETDGAIAPKRVMFVGTPPLHGFTYEQMRRFARTAIEHIASLKEPIQTITTTIHGTGYGLDGGESLQRLVQGFREGLATHNDTSIEKVIFVSLGEREARMLSAIRLVGERRGDNRPGTSRTGRREREPSTATPPSARQAVEKKRVFVAMPFAEEFENVYEFGIYPAVRNCGFICERVDEVHFTGDILTRIREGIESASLVIADLTEARPNVYLEVGYAWGRKVPVICVARKGEKLHFDVTTHRCIFYGRFSQFAKDLEELIRGIQVPPG